MPKYELIGDSGYRYVWRATASPRPWRCSCRRRQNTIPAYLWREASCDETGRPAGMVVVFTEAGQVHFQCRPNGGKYQLVQTESGPPRLEPVPVLNRAMRKVIARATGTRHRSGCGCPNCGTALVMLAAFPDMEPEIMGRAIASLHRALETVPLETVVERNEAGLCWCGEPATGRSLPTFCDEHTEMLAPKADLG